jgi:type VI protein secretion system component VasF
MDNKKKLRRMAIWMIAVFAAAFAIVLTVLYLPYSIAGSSSPLLQALASGWWLILILAVICVAAYYGYKLYLNRKK